MTIRVKALPYTFVVHVLGVIGAVMVTVWCIHFRGGLAWNSSIKSHVFNANTPISHDWPDYHWRRSHCKLQVSAIQERREKLMHLVLHAVALLLGIIGICAAFKYHNESSIPNLYSLHSWLGIGVISFYGIQWMYGFVVLFYPGGSPSLRRESVPWHAMVGLFVYMIAILTAVLGFLEKLTFLESSGLAKYGSEAFLVNFTAIVTIFYGVFVVFSAHAENATS